MPVGGLVAFGAYKMTSKQSQDIQAHTGADLEEMTDQELVQAMDDLGIEKQEVTDADKDA